MGSHAITEHPFLQVHNHVPLQEDHYESMIKSLFQCNFSEVVVCESGNP
jgi:hypothetical protein